MEEKKVKPQLHQSHLAVLYRCGYKFQRIYLEGHREPSTTASLIGTATHGSVAQDLTNKIDRGILLPKEAVQDLSRDEFQKAWIDSPVVLNEEERLDGLQKTRDLCQDITIELALLHHYSIAPKLNPKYVERKWVIEAVGYPFDLAGTMDVDEEQVFDFEKGIYLPKSIVKIRDTKTKSKNFGQREVDTSEQYTFYHWAKFMIDGVLADFVVQDNLLKPTKKRPAIAASYYSTRTKDDHDVVRRRFETACSVIDKQAFTPANPTDWWCSKDWCGFAASGECPYFNSKRSTLITTSKKENEDGSRSQSPSSLIAGLEGCLTDE